MTAEEENQAVRAVIAAIEARVGTVFALNGYPGAQFKIFAECSGFEHGVLFYQTGIKFCLLTAPLDGAWEIFAPLLSVEELTNNVGRLP